MPNSQVTALHDDNFDAEVVAPASRVPVLVEFGAAWCPPCRALRPVLERLAETHAGRLRVAEVDIDRSPLVARRLAVRGAPTMIVFRDGHPIARHLGGTTREKLLAMCGLTE
jgi:thioredoxin 1